MGEQPVTPLEDLDPKSQKWIHTQVAKAPELSEAQRAQLEALFAGGEDEAADA